MPKSKKSSRLFNSFLALLALVLLACGPGLFDSNEFPGLFMPQSGYTPSDAEPYYFSPSSFYVSYYDFSNYPNQEEEDKNLKEWKAHYHLNISDSIVAAIVYQAKDDPQNPFYEAIKQDPAAWHYLKQARQIEQASETGGTSWDTKPADTVAMKHLFAQMVQSMAIHKQRFLKDKFAFQAIKLAHELGLYDSCINMYNHYFGQISDSGTMKYLSLSRMGGALLDKGDTAQSVYVFSQVFDQCPSRRRQAYMSLRLNNIRFIPKALKFCKNIREKAAVYTLCAIQPWQEALPLMDSLVAIDPNLPYLELIMGREINKNEGYYYKRNKIFDDRYDAWGLGDGDSAAVQKKGKKITNYFQKLQHFALTCSENPQIKDKAFWLTASAYICYVSGDYKKAASLLDKAKTEPTDNPVLKQQILLQQLLLETSRAKKITPKLEEKVLLLLDSLRNTNSFYKNNALVMACHNLIQLYNKTSLINEKEEKSSGWLCNKPKNQTNKEDFRIAKAFILKMLTSYQMNRYLNNLSWNGFINNADQYTIIDNTPDSILEKVITFYSQIHPSSVDKKFMNLLSLNLNYYYWIKGKRALRLFRYQDAINAWQHVAYSYWQEEPFKAYFSDDPFSTEINDSYQTKRSATVEYSPLQFAQKMWELSKEPKTNPTKAAEDYYLLGCGAYNLSYYGNSWILTKRFRSSSESPMKDGPVDSVNYFTTNKALFYFNKAMELSKDSELAAKSCFMAAKCEQKEFLVNYAKNSDYYEAPFFNSSQYGFKTQNIDSIRKVENETFHNYFNLFQQRYSQTQFNKEVINECAYYRDFALGRQ